MDVTTLSDDFLLVALKDTSAALRTIGMESMADVCIEAVARLERRREALAEKELNPERCLIEYIKFPVQAKRSAGVLWLVLDREGEIVTGLLTQAEAERLVAWMNETEEVRQTLVERDQQLAKDRETYLWAIGKKDEQIKDLEADKADAQRALDAKDERLAALTSGIDKALVPQMHTEVKGVTTNGSETAL